MPTPARSAPGAGPPALGELASSWNALRDYSVDIAAVERARGHTDERHMRFWYLRPEHAKLQVLSGALRGIVIVWNGGATMTADKSGLLHFIKKSVPVGDPRAGSLRGNSILTPILGPAIACMQAHRADVSQSAGPAIGGEPTDALTFERPGGLHCSNDSAVDQTLTKDVLYLSRRTHLPLRRVRYEGVSEVETWEITGLKLDSGLRAEDFR